MQRLAEDLDLFRSSMCLALLYRRTPMKTTDVPRPDRKVTGLPNMMTDSQMSRTRLAVLATLEMANLIRVDVGVLRKRSWKPQISWYSHREGLLTS